MFNLIQNVINKVKANNTDIHLKNKNKKFTNHHAMPSKFASFKIMSTWIISTTTLCIAIILR